MLPDKDTGVERPDLGAVLGWLSGLRLVPKSAQQRLAEEFLAVDSFVDALQAKVERLETIEAVAREIDKIPATVWYAPTTDGQPYVLRKARNRLRAALEERDGKENT